MRERLPCDLPGLPQPIALGGVPDPSNENAIIVTRDGLEQLALWISGTRNWIRSAAKCLETP